MVLDSVWFFNWPRPISHDQKARNVLVHGTDDDDGIQKIALKVAVFHRVRGDMNPGQSPIPNQSAFQRGGSIERKKRRADNAGMGVFFASATALIFFFDMPHSSS